MEIEKLKETLVLMEFNMTKIESARQKEFEENKTLKNDLETTRIECKDVKDKIEEKNCIIASLKNEKTENDQILQHCLGEMESAKHELNLKRYALEGVICSNLKLQERIAELESKNPALVSEHASVTAKRQISNNNKSPLEERSMKSKQNDEKKKLPFKKWKPRSDPRQRDLSKALETNTSETNASNEKEKKSKYQRKREKKDRKTLPEKNTSSQTKSQVDN